MHTYMLVCRSAHVHVCARASYISIAIAISICEVAIQCFLQLGCLATILYTVM